MIISSSVRDVINYIEKNLEKPIRISDIVRYSGYSRRYIEILFTQHTSWSIGAYIRNRRLTRAAVLLRLTRTSIIEIALSLQFSSQQSFSREFKKLTQYTPSQYRKLSYWDTSILCGPLNVNYPLSPPLQIVELPEETIFGYQINYELEIPQLTDFKDSKYYRWNSIFQQLSLYRCTVILINNYSPGLYRPSDLSVITTIGISDPLLSVSPASYTYGGGTYARLDFSCNKDAYELFCHNIYMNILPFYKIKRRKGADIEFFFYDKDLKDTNYIKGYYYIPITND